MRLATGEQAANFQDEENESLKTEFDENRVASTNK